MWARCEIFFATVLFGIASHFMVVSSTVWPCVQMPCVQMCNTYCTVFTFVTIPCHILLYHTALCCILSHYLEYHWITVCTYRVSLFRRRNSQDGLIMHVTSCHNWAVSKPPIRQQCSFAFRPMLQQQQQQQRPCTDTTYTSSLSAEGHFLSNHIIKEITKQIRLCLKKVITPINGYQKQLTVTY